MIGSKTKKFDLKETYPLILESVNDLIAIVESRNFYKFLFINEPQFMNSLGYKSEDLIGKSILDFIEPNDSNKFSKIFKRSTEIKADQAEIRIKNKNGKFKWFECKIKTFKNSNKKKNLLLILKDLSKYKNLEQSKERFQLITENANDLITIINQEFKHEYINEQAYFKKLGYSKEDIIGKTPLEPLHPDDIEIATKTLREGFQVGKGSNEMRIRHKNGHYLWFENKGSTFTDSDGNIKALIVSRDITERKIAQESLLIKNNAIESSINAIAIADLKGFLTYVNPSFLRMWGYQSEKEVLGRLNTKFWQLEHKATEVVKALYDKGGWIGELVAKRKDGSLFNVEITASLVTGTKDEPICMLATFLDITERKNAEEELIIKDKAIESSISGIAIGDIEGKLIYVNPSFLKIWGYDDDTEVLGRSGIEFWQLKEKANEVLQKVQLNETWFGDLVAKRKDGTNIDVQIAASNIRDETGENKGIIASFIDISEYKIAEQKLMESENRFKFLVSSSPTMIYTSKASDDYGGTFISENVKEQTGYIPEEFIKNSDFWISNVYPEDRERILSILSKLSKKENLVYDYRFKFKDGTYHWMRDKVKLITDKSGNPLEIIGSWTDITDLKKVEQKLKESEENFRTITEQSSIGIIILQDHIIKYGNQQASDISGYAIDEIKSWDSKEFIKVVHPEDRDFVMEQAIKKQNGVVDVIPHYYLRIINKNGEVKWLDNYSNTITYKGKKADLITLTDITEKKEAEKKLKESEEKFRSLFENSPNAILLLNVKGEILDCNFTTEKMSGFKKSELMGKSFLDVSGIPERYIPQVMKEFKVLLNEGITETYEIQLYTKEGKPNWVSIQGSLVNLGEENIIQVVIQDISEKMEAELKLKKSEEKYRNIIENTKDMYYEVDLDGNFTFFNDALSEISGYTREESMGTNYSKYMTEENSKRTYKAFNEVFHSEIPQKSFRYEFFSKDGRKIFGESSIYLRYDPEGNKIGFSGFLRDITDKIEAENSLKESEEKFRTITEQSFMGIIIIQEGVIKYANEIVSKIMGYSIKELKSLSSSDFFKKIHHDDLQIAINRFQQIQTGKKDDFPSYSYRVFAKSGDLKWIDVFSKIIKYRGKNAIFASIIDVTLRKEAEQKLKLSEEKFRTITEQSLMGILEYDFRKKNISYANPKLLEILGYDKEITLDKLIFTRSIYPDDIKKFYKSTEKKELEFRVFDKTGKLKWIKGNRLNQYNDNGELIGFITWLDDITEKKMYETLIYELNVNFLNFTTDVEKNIQMLLETCCKLLKAEVVVYCHRQIENGEEEYQLMSSDNEILNIESEEFKENFIISEMFQEKHDYTQTFINIDETKFAATDRYIKEKKASGCFGKLIMSQEGFNSGLCVFYQKNPFLGHQDILVLFLISDALEIEQRRWQVQQDLEEQNRLKTELLSRTSHELKTPLIAIKGFTDLLLTLHSSRLDTDTLSIIEDIREGGVRLEEIINLLLESSRLDQGLLELNKSTEDLSFLIKFVLHDLRGMLEMRNLKMILNIHEYLTGSFDKERMYEVISNLITNAIKYTPPGGEIKISSETKEKFYVICVEDNGIGFTEEEKSKLFKQFGKIERYGEGLDIDIKGSGLGLYISKKIVELHGGEIWAESEGKNKGSKFYFSLPII
ncbi:MAG: PAS domain S-box protein [Promethearchaeota archaeon]